MQSRSIGKVSPRPFDSKPPSSMPWARIPHISWPLGHPNGRNNASLVDVLRSLILHNRLQWDTYIRRQFGLSIRGYESIPPLHIVWLILSNNHPGSPQFRDSIAVNKGKRGAYLVLFSFLIISGDKGGFSVTIKKIITKIPRILLPK